MIMLGRSVSHAMRAAVDTLGPGATVLEGRTALATAATRMVLVVAGHELLGTLVPDDLVGAPACEPALSWAHLEGRVTGPDDSLVRVQAEMELDEQDVRAVVQDDGTLLGSSTWTRAACGAAAWSRSEGELSFVGRTTVTDAYPPVRGRVELRQFVGGGADLAPRRGWIDPIPPSSTADYRFVAQHVRVMQRSGTRPVVHPPPTCAGGKSRGTP